MPWAWMKRWFAAEPEPPELEDDDFELPDVVAVTDVLDLHGIDPKTCKAMVNDFLDQAVELNLGRLRIIHGKGKSVFKRITYNQPQKHPQVRDFYDAPPNLGGWGATIVEMKTNGD